MARITLLDFAEGLQNFLTIVGCQRSIRKAGRTLSSVVNLGFSLIDVRRGPAIEPQRCFRHFLLLENFQSSLKYEAFLQRLSDGHFSLLSEAELYMQLPSMPAYVIFRAALSVRP